MRKRSRFTLRSGLLTSSNPAENRGVISVHHACTLRAPPDTAKA